MPRYVVNESEDEIEPKAGRRTRAALAASATDSPVRRSSRIRHGSVNPDGSSPESITGQATSQITTRLTRRRLAAAPDLLTVPETQRTLRSRKNSASSNLSESLEVDSAPGTPRARAIKRLSTYLEASPGTPKPGATNRRSARASSETKSPPPVVRTTRRTRATSIDPEPTTIELAAKGSTPTKKRRQQVSVLPNEPVLAEEENEDKVRQSSQIDVVVEDPAEEIEDKSSPDKTSLDSTCRSSSPASSKTSPKNKSLKEKTDEEEAVDESLAEKSPEKTSATEVLSATDKFQIEESEEAELLASPVKIQVEAVSVPHIEAQNPTIAVETLLVRTKRHSLDKSTELGMKIEDLLNKSTEEQEKSPGNKENEKLNVSPEKIKKNLDFTVSNVNVVRGNKSFTSTLFVNKSGDRKPNTSLDERVLSKSRYDIIGTRPIEVAENRGVNTDQNSQDSNSENKSQPVVKSPKKNRTEEVKEKEEIGGERPGSKTTYKKIDETIVENEVIEEFTLDDSESEFSLTVDDDGENERKNSFSRVRHEDGTVDGSSYKRASLTKPGKDESNQSSDSESEIFDRPNPSRNNSRKDNSGNIQGKKKDTPKRRASLNSKEAEERSEVNKSDGKEDERRESRGKKEAKSSEKASGEGDTGSKKDDGGEEEAMDTNEREESLTNKDSLDDKESLDEKAKFLKVKASKNRISDSDSNVAFDNLFKDISAEEWAMSKKAKSPKDSERKRRASLKGREIAKESKNGEKGSDSEDNNTCIVNEKSWKKAEASDSDDTLILKKTDYAKKANKNKQTGVQMVVEEADSGDEETEEIVEVKKSPNKSKKANTSTANKSNDKIDSVTTFQEGVKEIDENTSEADTIPTNADNSATLRDNSSGDEDMEEEEQPASSKNTPKNVNKKSPAKSATKLKKSSDVYEFEDSSEGEEDGKASADSTDEEKEKTASVKSKLKSEEKKGFGFSINTPRTAMDRNYSTVAVVDSDSGSEHVTDPDCPSPDNSKDIMPTYLFDVDSSSDSSCDDGAEGERSKNSIDSDIAKEMNLAGDDDLQYSDDNVIGDDCRASETEDSDEDDGAESDDGSFVVADDDVESSDYSEDELELKTKFKKVINELELGTKFKRILVKSSSDEEQEDEATDEKLNRKSRLSLSKDSTVESPESQPKKLNFSSESEKGLSNKKNKKVKILSDITVESELSVSPSAVGVVKDGKELIKLSKSLRSLVDTTIDLCTPEASTNELKDKIKVRQSPGLNTSVSKKLRKNLVSELTVSTPDEVDITEEVDKVKEVEAHKSVLTPEIKTPNKIKKTPNKEKEKKTPSKEKKTPKSASKNSRDSMQLIEETASSKSNVSDLNKSMLTPNTESPVTKFLKKEKLNESLPLIELKKRASKSFDKKALNKMDEDEQEEADDSSETDEQKQIIEESGDEESNANDDVEENGDEVNGNSHQEDEEGDDTDEEPDKEEENRDVDEENDAEPEDEDSEESSEEEISLNKKKKKLNEVVEPPEIKVAEKGRKSGGKKSLSGVEELVVNQDVTDITPSRKDSVKKLRSASTSAVVNGNDTESGEGSVTLSKKRNLLTSGTGLIRKKRARSEANETPSGVKGRKKIRKVMKTDTILNDDDKESDSDEAPESLGFGKARTEALQEMKDVAASLKAAKEAKKTKRRDQLERIRVEKEAKLAKKAKAETAKNNLKRLPEDLLDNLSDVPQRPKKKRKLSKKEEPIVPSRFMFSPGKPVKTSLKIEEDTSAVSTGGGTTHFSVVNLEKVKKQPKKAAAVASFRDMMLARNPRQPVSAFLMYQAKQKASGKHIASRKQA